MSRFSMGSNTVYKTAGWRQANISQKVIRVEDRLYVGRNFGQDGQCFMPQLFLNFGAFIRDHVVAGFYNLRTRDIRPLQLVWFVLVSQGAKDQLPRTAFSGPRDENVRQPENYLPG